MKTVARSKPVTAHTEIDIEQLLEELREYKAILTYAKNGRVVLWTPGHEYVPARVRRSVAAHNRELKRLLGISDPRVCSNPELHNYATAYLVLRLCCPVCAGLAPYVNRRAC